MTDTDLRSLERTMREEGSHASKLRYRRALKYAGRSADLDVSIPRSYEVINGSTYGGALQKLHDGCSGDGTHPFLEGKVRLLTGGELMRERVREAETGEGVLWDNWHFTGTGFLYPANDDSRFKIVPKSVHLAQLPSDFREVGLEEGVSYDAIEGVELRRQDAQYDVWLEEGAIVQHPFWQRMLQPDDKPFTDANRKVLAAYARTAIARTQRQCNENIAMGVYLLDKQKKDHLRAFVVGYVGYFGCGRGDGILNCGARLVRVCPR